MVAKHETIYPQLKPTISAHDLEQVYTPTEAERDWIAELTPEADDAAILGFYINLKTFQRLGHFLPIKKVPPAIIIHIATRTGLLAAIPELPSYQRSGSRSRYYAHIRAFRHVTAYRVGGEAIVQQAVAEAALHHEDLPTLINIAIEALIAHRYELPGFSTLVKVAQRQRTATYATWYGRVMAGLTTELQAQLDTLFDVDPLTRRSTWDTLKDPAGQPTRKNIKQLGDRLAYLATFAAAIELALTLPEAKREHFANQATSYDRGTMIDIQVERRYTLMCALLQHLQATLLDDLTESVIKSLRSIQKDAKEALVAYHQQHQHRTDALISTLRDVVRGYQVSGVPEERMSAIDTVLAGNDERILQDCDAHLTYAGNNWAPFVWAAYKRHRAQLLRVLQLLPLHSLSSDRRMDAAITFMLEHAQQKRPWLSVMDKVWVNPILYREVPTLDLTWLPVGWWRLVTDLPNRTLIPHQVHRQHFEACVMMQVLAAFTSGDLCVRGGERYGDPLARLYSWEEYDARIAAYGEQLGIPTEPAAFVQDINAGIEWALGAFW